MGKNFKIGRKAFQMSDDDYSASEDEDMEIIEPEYSIFLPLKQKCKGHEKNIRNLTTSVDTAREKLKNFSIAYLKFNKENLKNDGNLQANQIFQNITELEELYQDLAEDKYNLRNEQDVYKMEIPRV